MTKAEVIARKGCANYNLGKCLGVMFIRVEGKLRMVYDSKFAGKDCRAGSDDCIYFNQIVMKGNNVN
tara:strand:- start:898 stop:1098 length:201 start_codon:yes stop_codon:yes gene_type:complete